MTVKVIINKTYTRVEGHTANLPGRRGGSLPRGVTAANPIAPEKLAAINAAWHQRRIDDMNYCHDELRMSNADYKKAAVFLRKSLGKTYAFPGEFAKKAWDYTDEETGLHIKPESMELRINQKGAPYAIKVHMSLEDYKGQSISASITRTIEPDGVIHHDYMRLPDELQGMGFGGKFYRQSEAAYMAAGIKRVEILANISVGGYAWARMGFSQESSYSMQYQASQMIDFAKSHGINTDNYPRSDSFKYMWDIAKFRDPSGATISKTYARDIRIAKGKIDWNAEHYYNGFKTEMVTTQMDVGKAYLLGQSWSAYKNLVKGDATYEEGQRYYSSKTGAGKSQ